MIGFFRKSKGRCIKFNFVSGKNLVIYYDTEEAFEKVIDMLLNECWGHTIVHAEDIGIHLGKLEWYEIIR